MTCCRACWADDPGGRRKARGNAPTADADGMRRDARRLPSLGKTRHLGFQALEASTLPSTKLRFPNRHILRAWKAKRHQRRHVLGAATASASDQQAACKLCWRDACRERRGWRGMCVSRCRDSYSGEGVNDGRLKLRMAAASRSRDAATGSLKRTTEGNRASGGPAKADQPACRVVRSEFRRGPARLGAASSASPSTPDSRTSRTTRSGTRGGAHGRDVGRQLRGDVRRGDK